MVLLHVRLTRHFTKSLLLGQLLTKIWINKKKRLSELNMSNVPLEVSLWQSGGNNKRVLKFLKAMYEYTVTM
jgi:hypothetical protein